MGAPSASNSPSALSTRAGQCMRNLCFRGWCGKADMNMISICVTEGGLEKLMLRESLAVTFAGSALTLTTTFASETIQE